MRVPARLRRRLEDEASACGVPVEWVLEACIELGLRTEDDACNDLVLAIEAVRDRPRIVRMPRRVKGPVRS